MSLQVVDAIDDPIDMLFDCDGHMTEHGRTAGACNSEQIHKPSHLESQIVDRPVRLGVGQSLPLAPRTRIALASLPATGQFGQEHEMVVVAE